MGYQPGSGWVLIFPPDCTISDVYLSLCVSQAYKNRAEAQRSKQNHPKSRHIPSWTVYSTQNTSEHLANTSETCTNTRKHDAPCVRAQITCLRHSGMPLLFYFLFWLYYIRHSLISTWAIVSMLPYDISE
jgi:hypothetical protein